LRLEGDIHCVIGGMGSGERKRRIPSLEEKVNGDKHYQTFYRQKRLTYT
jgi:hypothetical protein